MAMMKYLLDSVILIDHFNNISQASAFIQENKAVSAISVITRAEVLTGFSLAHRPLAAKFLNYFVTLNIETDIADLTAQLRSQYRWKLPDALQAAVAQHHQLILVTRNTKDFPVDKYNFVITLYQL
jgi:predicted nucleic acid-binding protein